MGFLLTRAGSVALVVAAAMVFASTASASPHWSAPTVLGPAVSDIGVPDVAVAPDGEAIATWVGGRPARILVSSRRPGKGWSPPVAIAPVREEVGEGPELAVSARKAVIVWSDTIRTRSGEAGVVFASTRLRGKRWSRPRNISAEKRWHEEPYGREPQVAMTPRGKAIVIWQAENEKHRTVSFVASTTQAAAGADWTAPVGIRGSYEAEGAQLAVSPAGEAAAIWGAILQRRIQDRRFESPGERAVEIGEPALDPGPIPRNRGSR